MEKKITVGNVCFIKNREGNKLLLLKRNREPMQHLCTGVGGKTRFDEDIHVSCLREVKEETGLEVQELTLRGVIKTLLQGKDSAWILFVYTAVSDSEICIDCDEGELGWVDIDAVESQNLIGFIREILPAVLSGEGFLEGTITHDLTGRVVEKTIHHLPEEVLT